MSTVGLQLLLFTLPLDLLINDVCTSLLELKFSRLIVLMVGYLPLWELISSSSARLRAAVRAVRSHHRPGQVRVRVVAHRPRHRVHVACQRFQTPADPLLHVLSRVSLRHKLLKRRPTQTITIKATTTTMVSLCIKCIILVLASSPSYMWCSLIAW